jgi:hypothetical protein
MQEHKSDRHSNLSVNEGHFSLALYYLIRESSQLLMGHTPLHYNNIYFITNYHSEKKTLTTGPKQPSY